MSLYCPGPSEIVKGNIYVAGTQLLVTSLRIVLQNVGVEATKGLERRKKTNARITFLDAWTHSAESIKLLRV